MSSRLRRLSLVALFLACGAPGPDCTPVRCDASTFPPACLHGVTRGAVCDDGYAFAVVCATGERALLCADADAGR